MADVWKSNPRHFCTYCKCWIADNKPSRDFHERGKRHQENVKKKISEMQKKSVETAKEEEEFNKTMADIERKAMAAFKKDIANSSALSEAYQRKLKEKEEAEAAALPVHGCALPPPGTAVEKEEEPAQEAKEPVWKIEFSDEGYPYFWNTITNEVRWTKPDDYNAPAKGKSAPKPPPMSGETAAGEVPPEAAVAGQEESSNDGSAENSTDTPMDPAPLPDVPDIPLPPPPPEAKNTPPQEETSEADEARMNRKRAAQPAARAYGSWETVPEPQPEPQVDLQLPTVEKVKEVKTLTVSDEPKFKFRTKTVNPIAQGLVEFKKRKLAQATRNIKKREDDR